MTIKIKHKRGTASSITTANPTLAAGELAFETDTRRFKVGDGTTAWSSLSYVTPYVTATDRILGRSSAGAGSAEEITCGSFGRSLIGSADAAAARTTLSVQPTASPAFTGTLTAAQARVNGSDSSTILLVNGGTKGVRFNISSASSAIEGVDNGGVSSYQPLVVGGSTLTLATAGVSAIAIDGSQKATLAAQLLVTAGSASACGVAFSGDTNTGLAQIGGADTASLVTAGVERVRVDADGNVLAGTISSGRVVNGYTFLTINNTSGSYVDLLSNGTRVGELGAEPGSLTVAAVGASIPLILRTNNAARVTVGTDGSLTAPDVYGYTVGATNRDLFIDDTGKLGYVSSIRASKTNISAIEDVSWLRELTPVSFHYRRRNEDGTYSDEPDGTLDYGLIAEDVEPVAPELCFYDVVDGEPQLRGVHYSKLITPMLRYIQQLEQRIAALEERINA